MSHGFMVKKGDTMMSVGEEPKKRPWHGLGTVLAKAPSIAEGIKVAHLDWEVELQPIATETGLNIESHKAVVRKDRNEVLGVVGKGYKPLQNMEAFNFFEPFIENELATLETAGCLFGGKKIFILAKIKSYNMVIDKDDEVEKFVLLSNSHDGSQALRVGFTPIRVVCNNTLTFAEDSEKSKLIKLTHRGNIVSSLEELRATMDLVNQQFLATEEQYKALARNANINTADMEQYVKRVFSEKKLEDIFSSDREKEIIEKTRKKLIATVANLWDEERKNTGKRNAWTLYNAVNSYLNHDRTKDLEKRYNALWFDDVKRLDKRAFDLACKL